MTRLLTAALGLTLLVCAQEDPGRPVLKRGGPAEKREPVVAPPSRTTGETVVREVEADASGKVIRTVGAPDPRTDLIERAREAAYQFTGQLPDFVCDQYVLRYVSKTLKPEWKLKDRVQLETLYTGGKEDYRNIRLNGKPLKKGSPEDSGSWSMGEFGTILLDVFSTSTNAEFRLRGDSTGAGLAAKVYDYSVLQPNSHWRVRYGREVKPAYKGAVWIDPVSARVLRIEMNSRQLPSDYEVDTVETTVDYGWVTIAGQRYLLPVRSENLACFRGTFTCTKNEIEFRNYRKFAVESQVMQVESELKFPGAEEDKAPKKKGRTEPPSITPKPEGDKKDPSKKE
jgi:hypothetical protein